MRKRGLYEFYMEMLRSERRYYPAKLALKRCADPNWIGIRIFEAPGVDPKVSQIYVPYSDMERLLE